MEQIVETCGVEQTLIWLEETLAIEARGGLMVNNGERRRTPGGVFFYLVKGHLAKELREQLFPYRPKTRKKKSPQQPVVQELPVQDASTEPVSENLSRLEELRNAEQGTLERLAAIQALPPSEKVGLMSVLKELQRIREEMKSLPDNLSPD